MVTLLLGYNFSCSVFVPYLIRQDSCAACSYFGLAYGLIFLHIFLSLLPFIVWTSDFCWSLLQTVQWSPYVIGQCSPYVIGLFCSLAFLDPRVGQCNRADHYIFGVWFLSFFFSSPNLSGHRLDVYDTSTYGVALVQI